MLFPFESTLLFCLQVTDLPLSQLKKTKHLTDFYDYEQQSSCTINYFSPGMPYAL